MELCGLKKSGKDGVCADGQTKKVTASKESHQLFIVYTWVCIQQSFLLDMGHGQSGGLDGNLTTLMHLLILLYYSLRLSYSLLTTATNN